MIEAKTEVELKELQEKVRLARGWAKEHFNAGEADKGRLFDEDLNPIPPSFYVDFPTVDTMLVSPSMFGMRSLVLTITYKLFFKKDGGVVWRPQPPFERFAALPLQFDNGVAVAEDVSEARKKLITYALLGVMAERSQR